MRKATIAILLGAAACRPHSTTPAPNEGAPLPPRRAAVFPDAWRFHHDTADGTFAEHAMVASNSRLASEAGAEVMRAGGNAIDGAVATAFALAVTYPAAGNLGGGGFMVIRMADGRTGALDFREVAPLAARRDMYVDPAHPVAAEASITGHLASGVPGSVAGLVEAERKFGKLGLARAIAPALRMARDGFVVDAALARSLAGERARMAPYDGSMATFFPDGAAPTEGSTFRQPALARTLALIAERGADGFYRGETADSIVAEMRRGGGIITAEDLAKYTPVWRTALETRYRDYTLVGMPPVSSGGTTIAETLNILEGYGPLPPFGSTAYTHRLSSAYQRAFNDRNGRLGDPAFVPVPVAELTDKAYASRLRAHIDTLRYTHSADLGDGGREKQQTTHYSVVDGAGNAVSVTTTLNNSYGSAVTVRGAGFVLNDEMDDFAAHPGRPNMFGLVEGAQNEIAPGKRMLSSMSPTIVAGPDGRTVLVVGAAGGPTIITATSQVVLDVIEHRMSLGDAMRAPRLHHQAVPDSLVIEANGWSPAVVDSLQAMGYGVQRRGAIANVNAVMRVPGGWRGMHEPRSSGGEAGY